LGLMARMATIIRAKMHDLLDARQDPRETLEVSYDKQRQMLYEVKRGVVDLVTAKRRLELQAARLRDSASGLDDEARQALANNREDLARQTLQRKQEILQQADRVDAQIADLEKEQERLAQTEQRLQTKIEAFRTRKETIKAQYSAAEAEVKIGEAATGISEEMADVGLAIQRAEDKTSQMRARAAAIDEMVNQGLLSDVTDTRDPVERRLAQLQAAENADKELAALKQAEQAKKGQLPAGQEPEDKR